MSNELEKKEVEKIEQEAIKEQPLIMKNDLITSDIIRQAEMQVEGIKKVKLLSIKVTNERDWISNNGQPYLQISGAMKIRQLWGVNIIEQKLEKEVVTDDNGTYIMYTASGKAVWKNNTIEDIGTCSTRDDFFGKEKKDGEKKASLKELADVDLENVKKKAVTNLHNRILKKILGFNPTWDDLKTAGVDTTKLTNVKYDTKQPTNDDRNLAIEVGKMLTDMYGDNASKMLETLTEFQGKDKEGNPTTVKGVKSCRDLQGKRLNICHGKVKKLYEEWWKENNNNTTTTKKDDIAFGEDK